MSQFKRALGLTLSVIILIFILVFAFELINTVTKQSGFSSGEVFAFDYSESILSGEVMGRKFRLDFSPLISALPVLEKATLLLPPPVQVLIRGVVYILMSCFL